MPKPASSTYRTTNWRAYNAALRQRGSLLIWFDPEMEWVAAPSGRRGRPATFSDAAMQTCLMLKALFGLPLRQTTGLVTSLLKLAKLDWPVPDFSTLCRRRNDVSAVLAPPSFSAVELGSRPPVLDGLEVLHGGYIGGSHAGRRGPSQPAMAG